MRWRIVALLSARSAVVPEFAEPKQGHHYLHEKEMLHLQFGPHEFLKVTVGEPRSSGTSGCGAKVTVGFLNFTVGEFYENSGCGAKVTVGEPRSSGTSARESGVSKAGAHLVQRCQQ